MIIFEEVEKLIEKSYLEFRNIMAPTLMIIKLGNLNIPLKINRSPWRGGEIDGPSTLDIIEDCKLLTSMFPLTQDILDLEKKYFDKFFERFETIQQSWKIMDLTNYHVMPFWAAITGKKYDYCNIISHFVYSYWETYPIKWDTYIMSGQQMKDREKEWDARGVKHLDDERRINSGSNDYKIKMNLKKWYILRRYYRALPNREDKDLGYTHIVNRIGIPSKAKALKALEQDKLTDFEPWHECKYGAFMASVKFQLWGEN